MHDDSQSTSIGSDFGSHSLWSMEKEDGSSSLDRASATWGELMNSETCCRCCAAAPCWQEWGPAGRAPVRCPLHRDQIAVFFKLGLLVHRVMRMEREKSREQEQMLRTAATSSKL
ncbi:uncharacterized protein ACNS7B_005698 isoform 3-T5 [Menidia menidia]